MSDDGERGLEAFIRCVRANQDALIGLHPDALQVLVEADELFYRFREILPDTQRATLVALAVRCHSLYLTAGSAAMAGSTMEVHVLLRGALECAGYAVHLAQQPELDEVWLSRSDRADGEARRAVRGEFSHKRVCSSVDRLGDEIGQIYRELYDAAIDLGAHPNVIGVMSSFRVELSENERTTEHHILTADLRKVLHTVAMAGQVGAFCVSLLTYVFTTAAAELTERDFASPLARLAALAAKIATLARADS